MQVKNNRNNFVKLQFSDGKRKQIYPIKPGQKVDIPTLKNLSQVNNKFLFTSGNLSFIESEIEPVFSPKVIQKESEVEEYIGENKKTKKKKQEKR